MTNSSSRFDRFGPASAATVVTTAAAVLAAPLGFMGYDVASYGMAGAAALAGMSALAVLHRARRRQRAAVAALAEAMRAAHDGHPDASVPAGESGDGFDSLRAEAAALIARGHAPASGQHEQALAEIAAICAQISRGNFEARIIEIASDPVIATVQHKVNDMIDRCDAFVREATASLAAVCKGIYYRRIMLGGLNGAFRVAATRINDSVAQQGKLEEERQKLQRAVEANAKLQAAQIAWLTDGLKKLSGGDLTFRLADMSEESRPVQTDFNCAMAQLQDTMAAVVAAAAELLNAASEVSGATTDLSQRTEEQAAALEQTSAAMEEIAATVKLNADNARQARESATRTHGIADHGGAVAAKAVEAMARIEESSDKISDIIGVIDEIARQTNLLALNAAVEAARAGDAGRGFAVVASEVRALAQRSSQAATDIKDLITNSSGQVKEGVELVNDAGTALTEIVESIKGVAAIVAQIADASAEQSGGIEQVNKALEQMDETTQQNSALVEENAATAKTLESQAMAMRQRVAAFRLEDGAQRPQAAPSAAPRRGAAGAMPARRAS